ncbi:MAG: radical SAM family heme chaperone HemW [Ruminococcaceae bacterium]|nr:radical SAM family heme chaperone HemW [Oscillospiraceae bacterium]
MKQLGLYIHIPFCVRKCNYCDFYSVEINHESIDKYISNTLNALEYWKNKIDNNIIVDTIYFGGGTPSVLSDSQILILLEGIYNNFKIANNPEITIEVNPKSVTKLNLKSLKHNGINRISMGLQSSIDEELIILGRLHTKYDAQKAIDYINKSGIFNYSLDVMTGIPLQTIESLNKTIDFCINNKAPHISTYMLKIEKNTPFYENKDKYPFASEDTQADYYEFISKKLSDNGYRHYEISNFCKNDLISRHNTKYWLLEDYLGIGPSAHSMINGKRFYYPRSLKEFTPDNIIFESEGKTAYEYIMLSLRTDFGFKYDNYFKEHNKIPSKRFMNTIKILSEAGFIICNQDGFKLTDKGFLLSNSIISILLDEECL